jgi:hypothetical protein
MTDIYLLGCGQHFPGHVTPDTFDALRKCITVFCLLREDDIDTLPPDIASRCESVWHHYRADRPRYENYIEVANLIVETATTEKPVGWFTLGNPRVLDSVSELLIAGAQERNLSVKPLPAISSIDTVLMDVGYDPGRGVLVVEATALVANKTIINPTVAALIFQPGVFGTRNPRLTKDAPKPRLDALRDHLLNTYASDHKLAYVTSSPHIEENADVAWMTVASMVNAGTEALSNSTLFIPPVEFSS